VLWGIMLDDRLDDDGEHLLAVGRSWFSQHLQAPIDVSEPEAGVLDRQDVTCRERDRGDPTFISRTVSSRHAL
jgi:hypothetical protein